MEFHTPENLAHVMRFTANLGVWNGDGRTSYYESCRRLHQTSGTMLIFTRDTGHHTSGWFKNPDYERCYHLSLSFWDLSRQVVRSPERDEVEQWVKRFFGDDIRFVWEESAASDHGKAVGVRHFRVFCDPSWHPILPKGEVYSKLKTELGWLSWSDRVHADEQLLASGTEREEGSN